METMKRQFSWFGGALIVLGTLLLLRKLHLLHFEFSQVLFGLMILWGLVQVGRGFSRQIGSKVFWGTVIFLYGVFFLLRDIDTFDISHRMVIPATFLIVGMAFLMMWLNNFRDWYLLIPALFMGGVGVAFILSELGYLSYWDVWDLLHRYWPVVIILLGLAIMFRRSRPNLPPPPVNPPMPPPTDEPVNQAG